MKPHFLLTEVQLTDRKVIKDRNRIDVTSWGDPPPYPKYLERILKSEKVVLQLTLESSGKTKRISNEKILAFIFNKLKGEIK